MADPSVSISAATSLGRNYATLNGSVTPNGTARTWWAGRDQEDGVTNLTESRSDTEYYFEFVNGTDATSPVVIEIADINDWDNTVDYPRVTTPIEATGATPIVLTPIAYMLTPGATYYVRLVAKRILYPGLGNGERYRRENQPYELFFTAPVTVALSTA